MLLKVNNPVLRGGTAFYGIVALLILLPTWVRAADPFFRIEKVAYLSKAAPGGKGLFNDAVDKKTKRHFRRFVPCAAVTFCVREKIAANSVNAKVYFFDNQKRLLHTTLAGAEGGTPLPQFLEPGKGITLYLPVPSSIEKVEWNAVATVGDSAEADAKAINGEYGTYSFPELDLTKHQGSELIVRHKVIDPVVEQVVHTRNSKQPQITLFMRPPKGISDYSDVKGVLCACMLAKNLQEIRSGLLAAKPSGYFGVWMRFADAHKLAIIAWGSRHIWKDESYFEEDEKTERLDDVGFEEVANAWERGVKTFGEKFGIPTRDFLIAGYSASGQWAHRLVLRKPEYFLAIHIHIPCIMDEPRPEANRVLWLITGGELDANYEHTKRFFQDATKLGYPIIHKGIVGLHHQSSAIADHLEEKFFEYALSVKAQRDKLDQLRASALFANSSSVAKQNCQPWPKDFQSPPFYGDIVNQDCFPASQMAMIPPGFRTPLPTKDIADAWNH